MVMISGRFEEENTCRWVKSKIRRYIRADVVERAIFVMMLRGGRCTQGGNLEGYLLLRMHRYTSIVHNLDNRSDEPNPEFQETQSR
jgi:hypothetical protein